MQNLKAHIGQNLRSICKIRCKADLNRSMFLEDKELIYKKLTLREDKILFNLYLFSERVEKKINKWWKS